jgi:hypothetical protein
VPSFPGTTEGGDAILRNVRRAAFVVIIAKAGREPTDAARLLVAQAGLPGETFVAGRHVAWSDDSGRVLVGAWQCASEGACRWSVTDAGIALSTGDLRWRGRPWAPEHAWAVQLRAASRQSSLDEVAADLVGSFTALVLGRDGTGHIVNDQLGQRLLFMAESRDVVAVASTARLAALGVSRSREPTRDLLGAARLAFSRVAYDERTGFTGVRALPPGHGVEIGVDAVRLSGHDAPWTPTDDERGLGPEELLQRIHTDLADSLLAFADQGRGVDDHVVDLTGGMDSRLLLAVAMHEGLDRRLRFRTVGLAGLADVEIATEIAERFDLDHRVELPLRESRLPWVDRVRAFVARTDGMVNIWEERSREGLPHLVRMSGLPGEMLRSPTPFPRLPSSFDQVITYHLRRFSRLHLLRPEAEEASIGVALDELESCRTSGPPLDDADGFALQANRHRLGLLDDVNPDTFIRPMGSIRAVRAAFALGPHARYAALTHFALVADASPALALHRLTGSGWNTESLSLLSTAAGSDRRRQSTGPRHPDGGRGGAGCPSATTGSSKIAIVPEGLLGFVHRTAVDDRTGAIDEVLADESNPAWEAIDRHRVIDGFARFSDLPKGAQQELYGAITAAIWLG